MAVISADEIKTAFRTINTWPGWSRGQSWNVPVILPPLSPIRSAQDEAATLSPRDRIITFRAEKAIDNRTGKKVWLFYGVAGDLKVLCEVCERK